MTILDVTTDPPQVSLLVTAKRTVGVDVTAQLDDTDTITNVEITMTDMNTGLPVSGFVSSPTVDGNIIIQAYDGHLLEGNHSYRVTVTFTANPENDPSVQFTLNAFPAP